MDLMEEGGGGSGGWVVVGVDGVGCVWKIYCKNALGKCLFNQV